MMPTSYSVGALGSKNDGSRQWGGSPCLEAGERVPASKGGIGGKTCTFHVAMSPRLSSLALGQIRHRLLK